MTTPDRLAAAVAQGHEDAVQAWPQEDAPRPRWSDLWGIAPDFPDPDAPVSSPAGEDVERVAREAAIDAAVVEMYPGHDPADSCDGWQRDNAEAVVGAVLAALSARPVQAQDDGEVERLRERMPCDGGCDWNSGPEETCSLHGRAPRDIWDVVNRIGAERDAALARAEAAEGRERALREALAAGEASDGYHTHRELYDYRMLYNAHAAHGWLAAGIPVVKSWRHSDGEECFGGGWFIVTATLPTGQVSNHYRAEHWDLFDVPAVDLPPEYDGHTPADAADRLRAALSGQPVAQEGEEEWGHVGRRFWEQGLKPRVTICDDEDEARAWDGPARMVVRRTVTPWVSVETGRPSGCCGKCPPIEGGGYDCTCDGNPRCTGPVETGGEGR